MGFFFEATREVTREPHGLTREVNADWQSTNFANSREPDSVKKMWSKKW